VRRLLVRLYPAAWRRRYGDEFEALLEERALGPFDVADVLLGAFDAHLLRRGLRATSGNRKGFTMSLRLGGSAAILGALLWVFGFGIASGISQVSGNDDPFPAAAMILAGTVFLLFALVGLSAFQARQHPALVWAAFAIPALGNLVSIVGLIGMAVMPDRPFIGGMSPWAVWSIGLAAMVGGSVLFAAATWLTRALSRGASLLLGASALVVVVGIGIVLGTPGVLPQESQVLLIPIMLAHIAGWIWLGIDALRRSRPGVSIAPA